MQVHHIFESTTAAEVDIQEAWEGDGLIEEDDITQALEDITRRYNDHNCEMTITASHCAGTRQFSVVRDCRGCLGVGIGYRKDERRRAAKLAVAINAGVFQLHDS